MFHRTQPPITSQNLDGLDAAQKGAALGGRTLFRAMRSPRLASAALVFSVLLCFTRAVSGVPRAAKPPTFQSRFRTELGKEWQVHLHLDSGRAYYFDKESGVSTWTDPRDAVLPGDHTSVEEGTGRVNNWIRNLLKPGDVKFSGGGLGGALRGSTKRAKREAGSEGDTGDGVGDGWFRGRSPKPSAGAAVAEDDYGAADREQRVSGARWSLRGRANGTPGLGTGGSQKAASKSDLLFETEETRGEGGCGKSKPEPFRRHDRGMVAVAACACVTSLGLFGVTTLRNVQNRAGAGGVEYAMSGGGGFLGAFHREALHAARARFAKNARAVEQKWSFCSQVTVLFLESLAAVDFKAAISCVHTAATLLDGSQTLLSAAAFFVLSDPLHASALAYDTWFFSQVTSSESFPLPALVTNVAAALALRSVKTQNCLAFLLATQTFGFGRLCFSSETLSSFGSQNLLESMLKKLACVACTGVLLARVRQREETKLAVRRRNSRGAISISDDEDVHDVSGFREYPFMCGEETTRSSPFKGRTCKKDAGALATQAKETGAIRSLAFLVLRVSVAASFAYAAVTRLISQEETQTSHSRMLLSVLPNLCIALPLALGYETPVACRAAAAVTFAGAFWRFALASAKISSDPAAERTRFVSDMAITGGLLLLRNTGGGRYAVDAFRKVAKKRE